MRIVLFCGKGVSSEALYFHLDQKYEVVGVVLDGAGSPKKMLKRRIKRLGLFKVLRQLLFMKLIVPILKVLSRKRQIELWKELPRKTLESGKNLFLPDSINNRDVIEFTKKCKADAIVVNGTRIISEKIIEGVKVPLINIHVGITPKYRGVHGGYWALANNDAENFGVTVHLIDTGIDTGGIISQKKITITSKDNFCTYPILQLAQGLECIDDALEQIRFNSITIIKNSLPSQLYYHPTIDTYLFKRLMYSVK